MKRRRKGRLAIGVATAFCALVAAGVASAKPPQIVVQNGVTQPVFGYADAIRERCRSTRTSTATATARTT